MFFVAATLEAPAFDIILRTQILPEKKRIAAIAPFTPRRYQQILRMPGLGFVLLYAYNVLPGIFALLAGLGDAMAAVDAIFIGIKLLRGSEVSKQSLLRWNSYGLIDFLIAITVDTLLRSSLLGGTTSTDPLSSLPLSLIPTLVVPFYIITPLIIFLQSRMRCAPATI